ncbi:uncharacterized protein LOC113640209 isoform X3 [Tachysurus fulvidraco]|uniref:uncharacterized protein LOC113640209 isoform X3 n=1 Tax=Tachysurus fulvidraco TaxID=1234273 RepID=UPI001FEF52F9|nr:uncharacterized protein LOC113640209 isoform X3 [Tachysurus fulvidraco]
MEMQQRLSRSQNVYEQTIPEEQTQTEEIYRTPQLPQKKSARNAPGKKRMVLLIMNILLTIVLLVTVIHYHHFRQRWQAVLNNQKTNQEMWYLHGKVFYLFRSDQGDCETATLFCALRKAKLTTVTKSNRDWLHSQINGKYMLVQMSQPQSSGDGFDFDTVDDESDCEIFGATSQLIEEVERVEGWVCERAAQGLKY